MSQTTFDKLEDITGLANDSELPESLPTREVFDRLIAVLEEATSEKANWEDKTCHETCGQVAPERRGFHWVDMHEGRWTPEQEAYEQGAFDGIGCLYVALAAVQDLAHDRPTESGRIGVEFPV